MIGKGRIILMILCVSASTIATAHAERIRTAIPGANLNYLSVYSAEERKFFRDEGLENEIIAIGGPAGIAALVSGDVDFSGAGGSGRAERGHSRRAGFGFDESAAEHHFRSRPQRARSRGGI